MVKCETMPQPVWRTWTGLNRMLMPRKGLIYEATKVVGGKTTPCAPYELRKVSENAKSRLYVSSAISSWESSNTFGFLLTVRKCTLQDAPETADLEIDESDGRG